MKTQEMDLTFDEKVKHRSVHTSVCYASLFNLRLLHKLCIHTMSKCSGT